MNPITLEEKSKFFEKLFEPFLNETEIYQNCVWIEFKTG